MSFSIQRAVSDGTLALLPISIEYFDREEISVLFDGVVNALPWSWVGVDDATISFTPPIPNMVEVSILRSTDLSALRHSFSMGAQFTATSLDESLLQILHIAQESKEGSGLGEVYQDLNFHGFKAINMGGGSAPGDAVNHAQMQVHDATIIGYKDAAQASAVAAAASAAAAEFVPSGTRIPFAQATAPTGWTQDTTDAANNRMLRVVNTTGGGSGGSHSPILNNVVPAHTHGFTTGNESAAHTHAITDPGHTHTGVGYNGGATGSAYPGFDGSGSSIAQDPSAPAVTGISIGANGTTHTHSGTTDNGSSSTNWTPRYIDLIICSKN